MPAGSSAPATTIERCRLTDHDIDLFKQGTHTRRHEKMGAHACTESGRAGVRFAVWAPNARRVSVIGDFDDRQRGELHTRDFDEQGFR